MKTNNPVCLEVSAQIEHGSLWQSLSKANGQSPWPKYVVFLGAFTKEEYSTHPFNENIMSVFVRYLTLESNLPKEFRYYEIPRGLLDNYDESAFLILWMREWFRLDE